MNEKSNSTLKPFAQKLRREMTKEERRLWYEFLKDLPLTVNRQKVLGPYIVDFYCASAKVIIELDGFQHREEDGAKADKARDSFFAEQGISVLRYSNNDLNKRFSFVCADIARHLGLLDG